MKAGLIISLALLTLSLNGFAQNEANVLTPKFSIELGVEHINKGSVNLELRNFDFPSIKRAELFFSSITDNLVAFHLDIHNEQVELVLLKENQPDKKDFDWTAYLNKQKAHYLIAYQRAQN